MAKDKKFLHLFEYYMAKYPARGIQSGFQQNDVFKFNDNFKSDDVYEGLPTNVKEIIDDFIDDFRYKTEDHDWVNYIYRHGIARRTIYKEEKFPFEVQNIRF